MTSSPPVLLCFDGSGGALRAIQDAGRLLGPRTAVVLTVWEAARDLTTLDPVGDVVGRLSGIYAELDAAGLQAARDVAQRGAQLAEDAAVIVVGARGLSGAAAVLGSVSARVSRRAGRPVLVVPPPGDQSGGTAPPSSAPRTE